MSWTQSSRESALATEYTTEKMGQDGRQGIMPSFNERAGKEYVPESKDNSRKTEKRMTLKGKKERQIDAEYAIKKQ